MWVECPAKSNVKLDEFALFGGSIFVMCLRWSGKYSTIRTNASTAALADLLF
jgi:hypothetical protein